MLWPDDEPWPTCALAFDIQIQRAATATDNRAFVERAEASAARLAQALEQPDIPPEMLEQMRQMQAKRMSQPPKTVVSTTESRTPAAPIPLAPVVQLHARDIPHITFPQGADLLQVLWCPYNHHDVPRQRQSYSGPVARVFWRDSSVLTAAPVLPEPIPSDTRGGYGLVQCVVFPEQITEYPDLEDLPEELMQRISEWEDIDAIEDEPELEPGAGSVYRNDLSISYGLKAGGWPYWPHSPRPVACECGSPVELLLTIPNGERGSRSWTPIEEQHVTTRRAEDESFHDPTGFCGARYEVLIFMCRQDPRHQPVLCVE